MGRSCCIRIPKHGYLGGFVPQTVKGQRGSLETSVFSKDVIISRLLKKSGTELARAFLVFNIVHHGIDK